MQETINISAPNLINICIDSTDESIQRGRLYCYYKEDAVKFRNMHELFNIMSELMNGLDYPQSSVEMRSYDRNRQTEKKQKHKTELPDIEDRKKILEKRGELDTLVVYVKYRQKATWQGSVYHVVSGEREDFYSELELMKIIDNSTKKKKKVTKFV